MDNENRKAKIATYLIQLHEGNIKGNLMEVLYWISRNRGTTVHEMRTALSMAHQSLTPAVSNLLDSGLIREIGQVRIKDSFYSTYEFEPDAEKQDELADLRSKEKYKQWCKHGLKEFKSKMSFTLIQELES